MSGRQARILAAVQLIGGFVLGGFFLRVLDRHGWPSHRATLTLLAILAFATATILAEVRARLARIEKRLDERP